jgi:hypothetical protein
VGHETNLKMKERWFIWAFLYQATRGLQIGALPQGALAINDQTQSAMRSAFVRNTEKRNKLH